jgi:hypothetical protein
LRFMGIRAAGEAICGGLSWHSSNPEALEVNASFGGRTVVDLVPLVEPLRQFVRY